MSARAARRPARPGLVMVDDAALVTAGDVTTALEQVAAALWLLDQLEYGELSFLGQPGTPPSWITDGLELTNARVKSCLADLALKGLAAALAEAQRAATAVEAAAEQALLRRESHEAKVHTDRRKGR